MLKLKNVSKFYYSNGVIASGFSKVSIKLDIGEFVVITGESGSGKSTLLNVISGLDTYEEGEMYINGEETSHYGEADFEEYRKKYVSNIFQNFNLVNSYTVYQNVELVLLINGYKRKDVKNKVLDLINKVGLSKYKNTRVSKLSGGQKQRVAIARALAKDTPIIVCDEPTANLDSKSSLGIIKLLKEISLNKLVIIVTHDYASVENLATRVIQMHDGKIINDKKIKDNEQNDISVLNKENKEIGLFNIIRLGIRNSFNIVPKFILMILIFLFISASLLMVYGTMEKLLHQMNEGGSNWYLSDISDTRIIINKKDGSSITKNDFNKIKELDNVDNAIYYDSIVDGGFSFYALDNNENYEDYSFYGMFRDINTFDLDLDYGRMPENDNEVVVLVNTADEYYSYYFLEELDIMMSKKFVLYDNNSEKEYFSIVGIKYFKDYINWNNYIYGTEKIVKEKSLLINLVNSDRKIKINDNIIENMWFLPEDSLKSGEAYMFEDNMYLCKNYDCNKQKVTIDISNQYYSDSIGVNIKKLYNKKNYEKLFDKKPEYYDEWEYNQRRYLYISVDDYNKLFDKESYQSSVYSNHVKNVDSLSNQLENMGYDTLQVRKTLSKENLAMMKILNLIKSFVAVCLVLVLFFISYFVIRLILKSRGIYFSTLRILGASSIKVKKILDVELFVDASIGYLIFIIFILLVKNNLVKVDLILSITEYLKISHYILMYLVLCVMSYLLSSRFAKKMFKKSAIVTYREEV